MPQLEDFFDDFASYIASGDAAALAPYLAQGSNPDFLKIYRNGAIKAGVDALSANFPTLKQALGDESFRGLCRSYILNNWPTDTRLSTYGDGFSDYINSGKAPYTLQHGDFAKLDYAWLSSLLARDDEPLTNQSILDIMSENNAESLEQLQLASSVQLVHLDGDSMRDWVTLKFKADANSDTKKHEQNSKAILFWRQDNVVHYRSLNNFEDTLIDVLGESGSIFNAAEAAISAQPGEDLSSLFAALLSSGVLTRLSIKA